MTFKKVIPTGPFQGGLAPDVDPRHIKDEIIWDSHGVKVYPTGKIRTVGSWQESKSAQNVNYYDGLGDAYGNGLYVGNLSYYSNNILITTNVMFLLSQNTTERWSRFFVRFGNGNWEDSSVRLVYATYKYGNINPVMLITDNAAWAIDTTHGRTQLTSEDWYPCWKRFEYLRRTWFAKFRTGGSFTEPTMVTINRWDTSRGNLVPPALKMSEYGNLENFPVVSLGLSSPAESDYIHINTYTDGTGTWEDPSKYLFYCSYKYDYNQYTELVEIDDIYRPPSGTVWAGKVLYLLNVRFYGTGSFNNWNKRLTGVTVFYKTKNSDILYLLGEIDFHEQSKEEFFKDNVSGENVVGMPFGGDKEDSWIIHTNPPTYETYRGITGFTHGDLMYNLVPKDVVHAVNRFFALNCLIIYRVAATESTFHEMINHYPNRIYFTLPGAFDTWTRKTYISVPTSHALTAGAVIEEALVAATNEEIFIINVDGAEASWQVEERYAGGIAFKCQLVSTPFGIVWINRDGAFLYDGKLNSLVSEQMRSIWESWWNGADRGAVGYDPTAKRLFFYSTLIDENNESRQCLEYNFITKEWASTTNYYVDDNESETWKFTNPVIVDKKLTCIFDEFDPSEVPPVYELTEDWPDGTAQIQSDDEALPYIITKEFNFGTGITGVWYSIKIIYRNEASNKSTVWYRLNGSRSSWTAVTSEGLQWTNYPSKMSSTESILEFSNPIVARSIQFKVGNTTGNCDNKFEIESIAVVCRPRILKHDS